MRVGYSLKKISGKKESPLQQIFRNGIQLAKTLVLMVLLDFLKDLCGCMQVVPASCCRGHFSRFWANLIVKTSHYFYPLSEVSASKVQGFLMNFVSK